MSVLRRKLELPALEEKIRSYEQDIQNVKDHVLNVEKTVNRLQNHSSQKQVEYVSQRLEEMEQWNTQMYNAVTMTKENMEQYIDVFNRRLEALENQLAEATASTTTSHSSGALQIQRQPSRPAVPTHPEDGDDRSGEKLEEGKALWTKTSETEREIIRELYDAGYPMTYHELANTLNKSVSTIKNHINNMKLKGFDFQESIGTNNTKKHTLDERIKLFLTMRLNN